MNNTKPVVLAMVICDTLIEDKLTNKKSLIGIFNNIWANELPVIHPKFNIYVSLTDGHGSYSGKLVCVLADENKQIFQLACKVDFPSPEQIVELNYEFVGIKFPFFGNYHFEFWAEDQLLSTRRFTITQSAQEKRQE